MKRVAALALACLLAWSVTACGRTEEAPAEKQVFAMDTVMVLRAYGPESQQAVEEAEQELYRLEELLSRTRQESEIARLNANGGGLVSRETDELIGQAMDLGAATGGAFDITVAPVASAWGFTEDAFRVPEPEELESLLTHVGLQHMERLGQTADGAWQVRLESGTQIDLGGIAKGYASDRVAAIFRSRGVTAGTVSLGGNVWTCGLRPDGGAWRIGIQDPLHPEAADAFVGTLQLSDGFAVTSGGYQRYFEEDGTTYHHILDPATGYPADSGLRSVTVVAPESGAMCDAFSTALFVMGEAQALEFWRDGGYAFDLVLVTDDGRVVITDGLADQFTQVEGSGYVYETVS